MAGFLYFYEIKGGEEREAAVEAAERLWEVDSSAIREIEIVSRDVPIRLVRSEGENWKITLPRDLDADSSEIDRLADSAAELKRESVVEPDATDFSRFGLEPPQESLQIKTSEGAVHKIRFGNTNPTGSSTYAVVEGQSEVVLVANQTASAFRKELEDLRNHSILDFDQYEATSMELQDSEGTLRLEKEGDRWWIQSGERWAADSSVVSAMLGSLANGRLEQFFDENPEDYSNLGLDQPLLEVRIEVGEGGARKRLLIGSEKGQIQRKSGEPHVADEGSITSPESPRPLYVARDASRRELFYVDQELVDKLLKRPSDLRDKSLAVFQRWDIDRIILTNSKGTFTFTKAGGDWLFGEEKTKWDAVNGILDALDGDVARFIDQPSALDSYGLETPNLRVLLQEGEETRVNCGFGKETEEGVFAQVEGESAVKVVKKEVLEDLDKGIQDFLEPVDPGTEAEEPPSDRQVGPGN
jgi:hypothetical protein